LTWKHPLDNSEIMGNPEVIAGQKPASGRSQLISSKPVSRYLPAYRIEGQEEDENGAASPFLLLKFVSDNVDWPHNDNRVHGKRYRRMNGRH
jgi:hypothetical protein